MKRLMMLAMVILLGSCHAKLSKEDRWYDDPLPKWVKESLQDLNKYEVEYPDYGPVNIYQDLVWKYINSNTVIIYDHTDGVIAKITVHKK